MQVPKSHLLLDTLAGKVTDRPPVWLMRQAGRILPQYRKIRAEVRDFKALVSAPDLAAEVTIQPVDELGVDAAIIFSDILVIPEAMGLDYELIEKVGPRFPEVITTADQIERLLSGKEAAERLEYVYQALAKTRLQLRERVPLIGFCGAPWTLASYMIEGQGSKTFSRARSFLQKEPLLAEQLMDKISDTLIAYLQLKVTHGAQVLQVFDSWAGVLSRELYQRFGMKYLRKIADAINEVPLILFSKGAWFAHADLAEIPNVAIGLDWQSDPGYARNIFGPQRVLQGNLDPAVLYGAPASVQSRVRDMIDAFAGHHIVNLGHGVYPDTPLENVRQMVQTVKNYKY